MNLIFNRETLAQVPHHDQWLGAWLMEPQALQQVVLAVQSLDLKQHLAGPIKQPEASYTVTDGVAVIPLNGVMMKHASSLDIGGTSTVLARQAIRAAAQDPDVTAILLAIESPGGSAAGTKELAEEFARAGETKETFAHFTDVGASAAYWVGSAAKHISANAIAAVGSIGTFSVIVDSSKAAEQDGLKVTVVSAGEMKGAGVSGTEITSEIIAEVQNRVDGVNEFFLAAVAKNRGMSAAQVELLADGRVYFAKEAKNLGLIDGVMDLEDAIELARKPKQQGKKMENQLAEFKNACPGVNDEFLLKCVGDSLSLAEASKLWAQELATELAVNQELLSSTQAELKTTKELLAAKVADEETANKPIIGVRPLKDADEKEHAKSPTEGYWSEVRELQMSGKSRGEAMKTVNSLRPELRDAMSNEFNASR